MYIPEGVGNIAGASLVAFEAIEAFRTHPFLAVDAFEARVTDAGPVDVVALGAVLAGAGLRALEAVGADGTLLLAPAMARDMASSHIHSLSRTLLFHRNLFVNELNTKQSNYCSFMEVTELMVSPEWWGILGMQIIAGRNCIHPCPIISCQICINSYYLHSQDAFFFPGPWQLCSSIVRKWYAISL